MCQLKTLVKIDNNFLDHFGDSSDIYNGNKINTYKSSYISECGKVDSLRNNKVYDADIYNKKKMNSEGDIINKNIYDLNINFK